MAINRYDINGDIGDIAGLAFNLPKYPVIVRVEANSPVIADLVANVLQVGMALTGVDVDGEFQIADLISSDSVPISPAEPPLQYRVHIDYPIPTGRVNRWNQEPIYRRTTFTSEWFDLISNYDVSDLVEI